MEVRKLVRDAKKVQACLKELPDRRLVAVKPVKIYIPARYAESQLAEIGTRTYIVGIYGMVVEDQWFASSTVNAMIEITPSAVMTVPIEGDDYLEFSFDAGATVMASVDLVKTDTLVYRIYNEFLAKGRVPWYLGYLQMGRIFSTAKKHAGANIGANQEVTELLVSLIARDAKDRNKYYRTQVKTLADLASHAPAFIPLKSVQYAATNTLNKLAGSYFGEAVVSALVSPAERTERIESLLRK